MKDKLLVVIDMQNDFIDGALGTAEAAEIVPDVCEKIMEFDGEVVFTKDTHTELYPETQEGIKLPVPHCIKNTHGWELNDEIKELARNCRIFEKPTFGSIELANYIADGDYKYVELVGVCTDICVISNAILIKSFVPETPVIVDSFCCAGTNPESHSKALDTMRSCQIEIL